MEKKLAKFSYRINDSGIGTDLSFEGQNEEIFEDISFQTNHQDKYSYKTKNNGAMEDLCSMTRDSGITEEFSLSSDLLLYKARTGEKTELEEDASTWRTQDSSQNILDENPETRYYLERNNDYSTPCPILCKDENTDKSSSTRSGTQSPDLDSTQRDNPQSISPCRIDYSSIDYNEEHSDIRPAPYSHDYPDIRMENINLSLDQLYSAAKYEVEKTGFKLTETDPSIYSEDEEKKIEEDIIITELDSVSNRWTPTNSAQTCQQSRDGVESPREEPRMQVHVQELDKETFHFEDTPRTHLTEDRNIKHTSDPITTGENRDLDTCRDLEIQTFESPQENQEAKNSDVFQNKIRNFIQTIEDEEMKENHKPEDEEIKENYKPEDERSEGLDENVDVEEEERLSDEDLEKLKKKCLDRLKKSESRSEIQDYAANSSIQDFSNSQKLLKFLAESEEKDERTKSKVKTVSYSLHPDIPKLGDLLSKSVADLSEEVMNLNLGKY